MGNVTAIFATITAFLFLISTTFGTGWIVFEMPAWIRYATYATLLTLFSGNISSALALIAPQYSSSPDSDMIPLWILLATGCVDLMLGAVGIFIAVKYRNAYVNNFVTVYLRILSCFLLVTGVLLLTVVLPEVF
ncbi:MAG: hypothetical protein LBG70_04585 [Bifidobacteriaceae bacterium]|jgi:hypothetical protein|nr:hypothetical protein [Bifidobacteriaceae bacterium]